MTLPPFLSAARAGHNDPWRYIFTLLLSGFLLVSGTSLVLAYVLISRGVHDLNALPEPVLLSAELIPMAFLLAGLWVGMRWLHHRPFFTLIRPPGTRFRWGAFGLSALAWLALSAAGDVAMALANPGNYVFHFDPLRFWPYALAAVLLLPVQVAGEELVFRGYLTQGFGLLGGFWPALLVPGILFGLLHSFNPEVGTYGFLLTIPVYIGLGLVLGGVTLRTSGLEMALGLHLANNLYAALLVTFSSSVLPSPALFRIQQYSAPGALLIFAVTGSLYLLIVFRAGRGYFTSAAP